MNPALIAFAAYVLALLIGFAGRRDLAHPAVAFGVPWFAFAGLAQLRLTPFEHPWSTGFAAMVLGGGLLFVLAAGAVGGTDRVRGTITVRPEHYQPQRFLIAGVLLLAGSAAVAAQIRQAMATLT